MLDTMIDVFFSPGEASMQRAKASTANYWQDGFIALTVTLFFTILLYFVVLLSTMILDPQRQSIAPNERLEVFTALFIVLAAFAAAMIIGIMWALMVNLGITAVLVRYVSSQWPQVGPYFFITTLCIGPVLIFSPLIDFVTTVLPMLVSPQINGEGLSSIIFTPLALYQLYLNYLNLKVSFNLSGGNAIKVIFLPLLIFICALPCLLVTAFPLFLMSKP